jgi:hypothetical protein
MGCDACPASVGLRRTSQPASWVCSISILRQLANMAYWSHAKAY